MQGIVVYGAVYLHASCLGLKTFPSIWRKMIFNDDIILFLGQMERNVLESKATGVEVDLYPILQFPALGLMQLLKLHGLSLYSPIEVKVMCLPLNSDIRESMITSTILCKQTFLISRETD